MNQRMEMKPAIKVTLRSHFGKAKCCHPYLMVSIPYMLRMMTTGKVLLFGYYLPVGDQAIGFQFMPMRCRVLIGQISMRRTKAKLFFTGCECNWPLKRWPLSF